MTMTEVSTSIPSLATTSPATLEMTETIYLPDLEAGWLWPRRLNIHTADIRQECLDWAASFGAFTPRAQKAFDKCNFSESPCVPQTYLLI